MASDPYRVLGVPKTASADDIKSAYRKLAKKFHPDQNPGDKASETRFKEISAAFDIIGDEKKRARFDRGEIDADGREGYAGAGPGPGPGAGPGGFGGGNPFGAGGRFEGADFDEIFGMFGAGGPAGARSRAGGASATKALDVRATVEIDLEDAIHGATKRIAFSDGRAVDITIPPGSRPGQVLRLARQGARGRNGAVGDALIELSIRPHPIFRMEGADLHMDLPVSVPDAVLGGKIEAPTPDGPVALNIPKNSNTGKIMRLRGKGGLHPKTGERGDLLARFVVYLPEIASPDVEAFCTTWRAEHPYQPKRKS